MISSIWNIQNVPHRLMLIDEPDTHIHPDLQVRFADFLIKVAKQFELQIVVATHSTTLLSALGQFAGDECGVIYLDRLNDKFSAQTFTPVLKELAACLGGHALMGPLFGVPMLLVEGDDDYRIWSQVPRHHVISLSVIPCEGENIFNYQATLEKVFTSLREPTHKLAGYALLDGDKPNKQGGFQDHIRFIQLNCHEAENLYLSDEVLQDLGIDWDSAVKQIKEAAPKHGNKRDQLENAENWDRRNEDIKRVINEISQAIDPKHVHWTQRVGSVIGRSKPTGQLAEFLGESLISALWSE